MSRLQAAFHEKLGTQCGYCTPGMIMAAEALLRRNPAPGEAEIREALSGNLCRCTGYVKIIESVQAAVDAAHGDAMTANRRYPRQHRDRHPPAADRRRREGHGPRPLYRGPAGPRRSRRRDPEKPGRARRDPAAGHHACPRDARRARRDHRRRLRRRLRRHAGRAERVSARARARSLSRRADRRGGRRRRRHRPRRAGSDRGRHRAAAGVLRREGGARARRDAAAREQAGQHRARGRAEVRRRRGRLRGRGPGARGALPLRRGDARADGARLLARRIRRRARPADAALDDAGAVLRAPDARALPPDGRIAHTRGQALRRRRIRPPHRDAQLRARSPGCSRAPRAAR